MSLGGREALMSKARNIFTPGLFLLLSNHPFLLILIVLFFHKKPTIFLTSFF